jgi:glycosyltransferase involved in cell wall biosynthesis
MTGFEKQNLDISVIIPTFNRLTPLKRALHSVVSQTFPAAEIIVIDDGSTDGTQRMIRREYPEVNYYWQPNGGVSHARNRGIENASTEWLAFLDSDDEWLPKKLEIQYQALMNTPQFRIGHSDEVWIRRGQRVNPMKKHAKRGGEIFIHCLPRCVISPSAVIIHRSVFQRVGLFDETLPACEDYDLWLRICAVYPVRYIPVPLLNKYGGHEDQLSRKYPVMDRFRIQALENAVNSLNLTCTQRDLVLKMLLEKLQVVLNGAKKHGNMDLLNCFSAKQEHYEQLFKRTGSANKTPHRGIGIDS